MENYLNTLQRYKCAVFYLSDMGILAKILISDIFKKLNDQYNQLDSRERNSLNEDQKPIYFRQCDLNVDTIEKLER